MNRVGIFAWAPGLNKAKGSTTAGNSVWLSYLIDRLEEADWEVVMLRTDMPGWYANGYLDAIIIMWRWKIPGYPMRSKLHDVQWEYIQLAHEYGIPILIHDQDHMMTGVEVETLRNTSNVILAAPELRPRTFFRELHYPNPYKLKEPELGKIGDLIYIGNNYNRFDEAVEFLGGSAQKGLSVKVYGNWLEKSPGRESPEEVKKAMPKVQFCGRLPQSQIIDEMAKQWATIHLAKPSYYRNGFITIRWAEAAAAGILAFIPERFYLPEYFRQRMAYARVSTGEDIYHRTPWASEFGSWHHAYSAIRLQQELVRDTMTFYPWIDMLEELIS